MVKNTNPHSHRENTGGGESQLEAFCTSGDSPGRGIMVSKTIALIQVPNQRLFGTKAAAQYLGVHPDTLRRKYADSGWIKARRLGGRRVFLLEDLNAFIDALPDYQSYDYTAPSGKPGGKEIGNGN